MAHCGVAGCSESLVPICNAAHIIFMEPTASSCHGNAGHGVTIEMYLFGNSTGFAAQG